jgi:hypothetical protein
MDEKAIKLFGSLVAVGIVVCAIIVAIDLKIKNDLVRLAMKTDTDLQKIQAFAGTMVPKGVQHEQAANGSGEVGTWPLRGMPHDLHDSPVFRSDARMEKGDGSTTPSRAKAQESASDSPGGNSDQGIPESN